MTTFLNGIETLRQQSNNPKVTGVDTAIIGLVGTAPIFDVLPENQTVNKIVEVTDRNRVEKFGYNRSGYTIPAALEIIFKQGSAKVFVINVFDPDKHKANVSGSKTFENGTITLKECGIKNLVITKGDTTAELEKDYTFDGSVITVIADGALSQDDTVNMSYEYADPSKVTTADVIGGIDVDGNKSGIKKLKDCKSDYGYKAKILIAPVFSAVRAVDTELQVLQKDLKASSYIDAPKGTTIDEAIKGRNANGEINFNINDIRSELAMPYLKYYNAFENKYDYYPASAFLAGLRAELDRTKGVHWSISNQQLIGVEGLEIPVYFDISDYDSDTNRLNSQGITTVINDEGAYYTWGNRNSSFPSNQEIDSFSNVARMADYIEDSVEASSKRLLAGPINGAMIDRLVEMIKKWFAMLKKDGWIIDGNAWYDEAENTPEELASGHLVLCYEFLPPAPLERLTYKSFINIQLYQNIGGNK